MIIIVTNPLLCCCERSLASFSCTDSLQEFTPEKKLTKYIVGFPYYPGERNQNKQNHYLILLGYYLSLGKNFSVLTLSVCCNS